MLINNHRSLRNTRQKKVGSKKLATSEQNSTKYLRRVLTSDNWTPQRSPPITAFSLQVGALRLGPSLHFPAQMIIFQAIKKSHALDDEVGGVMEPTRRFCGRWKLLLVSCPTSSGN